MFGNQSRAENFLKMYRILEGILEKRFSGKRQNSSVVMEYLRDDDSEPYRHELNVCREIRNLLSHNADEEGEPLVEPSEAVLISLQNILEHVSAPKYAVDYGTPREKILWAHLNDKIIDVMHTMSKNGFSHVPVIEKGSFIGVFSAGSLFSYLEKNGLSALDNSTRIHSIRDALSVEKHGAEKYLFMPEETTIYQVRAIFERRSERNNRTSAIFITKNGSQDEHLIAMLTPWDVLKDSANLNA